MIFTGGMSVFLQAYDFPWGVPVFLQGRSQGLWFWLGACPYFCKAEPGPDIFTEGVFVYLQGATRACHF